MNQYIVMALLGFAGAFVNAASRLTATVWADETPSARQIARAWSQFGVAMLFGPVAAVAFTPWLVSLYPNVKPEPVAVATGLMANVLWPVCVEGLVPAFRKALGGWLTDLGASLTDQGGDKER